MMGDDISQRPERTRLPRLPEFFLRDPADLLRSPSLVTIALTFAGLAFFFLLFVLYTRFEQAPHRLFKVFIAGAALVVFLVRPRWALVGAVLAMPYVEWLPKSGIPFLNSLNILMGVLLVAAMVTALRNREPLLAKSVLRNPLLLFLLWILISWVHAWVFPLSTFPAVQKLKLLHQSLPGLYLFLLGHRLLDSMTSRDAERWIRWLALLMIVAPALGALGALWQSSGLRYGERVGGGLGDINKMGAFYAMALIWTIAMGRYLVRSAWSRLLVLGAGVLNVVALVLPNSRGGFVAFLVAGAGFAVSRGFKGLAFGLIFLASVPFWIPDYVEERVMETLGIFEEENRIDALNEQAGGRFDFWGAAVNVIIEHPILGVGYGIMPEATQAQLDIYKNTHNFYLELMGEMGIPALIILLVIFYRIIRRGRRLSRSRAPGWVRALGQGTVWITVSLMVANIFGSRFLHFSLSGYLFLAAALLMRATAPDLWPLRRASARSMSHRGSPPSNSRRSRRPSIPEGESR
jgi:O-antigen ligase